MVPPFKIWNKPSFFVLQTWLSLLSIPSDPTPNEKNCTVLAAP